MFQFNQEESQYDHSAPQWAVSQQAAGEDAGEVIQIHQAHAIETLADPVRQEILHDHYLDYLQLIGDDDSISTDRDPIQKFIITVNAVIEKFIAERRCIFRKNYGVIQQAIAVVVQDTPEIMTNFAAAYGTIKREADAVDEAAYAADQARAATNTDNVIYRHIQATIAAAIAEESMSFIAALRHGSVARIQLLFTHGLDLNRELRGKTTLMHVVQTGRADLLAALLTHHGANLEVVSDVEGWTALLFAASQRDANLVKVLLDAGANIHARGYSDCMVVQAGAMDFEGTITAFEIAAKDSAADREKITDFDQKRQETLDVFRHKYCELLVLTSNELLKDVFHGVFDSDRVRLHDYLCGAVRGSISTINSSDMTEMQKMEAKQHLLGKLEDIFVAGKNPCLYGMLFQHVTKNILSDFFLSFSKLPAHERDAQSQAITIAIQQVILEVQTSLQSSIKMAMSLVYPRE